MASKKPSNLLPKGVMRSWIFVHGHRCRKQNALKLTTLLPLLTIADSSSTDSRDGWLRKITLLLLLSMLVCFRLYSSQK